MRAKASNYGEDCSCTVRTHTIVPWKKWKTFLRRTYLVAKPVDRQSPYFWPIRVPPVTSPFSVYCSYCVSYGFFLLRLSQIVPSHVDLSDVCIMSEAGAKCLDGETCQCRVLFWFL